MKHLMSRRSLLKLGVATLSGIVSSSPGIAEARSSSLNRWLGMRNDRQDMMHYLPDLGTGLVRIAIGRGDFRAGDNTFTRSSLLSAIDNGQDIVVVYDPERAISEEQLRSDLMGVASLITTNGRDLKKIRAFNITNEPDNPSVAYWKGRDLGSVAPFVYQAWKAIQDIFPGAETIMPSTVDPLNQKVFLDSLTSEGINPALFIWGCHIYGGVADVKRRLGTLQSILKPYPGVKLCVDEVGVDELFFESVEEIKKYKPVMVIGHELSYKPGEDTYGVINRLSGALNPEYSRVKSYIRSQPLTL